MTIEIRKNVIVYMLFLIIAIAGIYYGNDISEGYRFLRIWNFNNILLLLTGLPFLYFQKKAKLPDFLQKDIPAKTRFLWPLIIGMAFGIADVFVFKVILHPEPYSELPPFTQPFPYSLFLYFSGAFEIEVFYRLIPLTIILSFGNWFKNGRFYAYFFLAGSVLTSIREPLEQMPGEGALLIVYSLITGFLMNFLQAISYRKAGFLASLSVRLGHYFIWHILLGIYIECCEVL